MKSILSFLGFGNRREKVSNFLEQDALIVDVRMSGEFKTGNIKGSINVPLESIQQSADKIKKYNRPVITCCVSGMRSGFAASKLRRQGIEAVNGGSWYNVKLIVDKEI